MKTFVQSELLLKSGAVNAVSLRVEDKPNFFSMRLNGTPGIAETGNRKEFFSALGFDESLVVCGEQVHGDSIAFVDSPGFYPRTDALVTAKKNLLLAVSVADCVPILIFDKRAKVAAAVHAGWRGTVKNIVAKTLGFLLDEFNSKPDDVVAFIGPSAGTCCYEVGEEVAKNFSDGFVKESLRPDKFMLDLKAANLEQLVGRGIPKENVEINEHCTICDANLHSFRRDGESSGRMLASIAIKQETPCAE